MDDGEEKKKKSKLSIEEKKIVKNTQDAPKYKKTRCDIIKII